MQVDDEMTKGERGLQEIWSIRTMKGREGMSPFVHRQGLDMVKLEKMRTL